MIPKKDTIFAFFQILDFPTNVIEVSAEDICMYLKFFSLSYFKLQKLFFNDFD